MQKGGLGLKESISDKQTMFNITDENYEAYSELKKIKLRIWRGTKEEKIISILSATLNGLIVLSSATWLSMIHGTISGLKFILPLFAVFGVDLLAMNGLIKMSTKLMTKYQLKSYKKVYPNINTDIDVNELEKALTKYEELKKVPKDIEKKKEQCLLEHSDEFKEKTTDEKIGELKEEIEFWEQVKIEEKYRDDSAKDNAKTLKKNYPK